MGLQRVGHDWSNWTIRYIGQVKKVKGTVAVKNKSSYDKIEFYTWIVTYSEENFYARKIYIADISEVGIDILGSRRVTIYINW